ncbi:MAG: acyl carrier protein [Actinomycetota bacterium]
MSSPAVTTFTDDLVEYIRTSVSVGNPPIEAETDLVMTGYVDSLGIVLVVEWLENQLGIEIDPGDVVIEDFESVAAMVAYLGRRDDVSFS